MKKIRLEVIKEPLHWIDDPENTVTWTNLKLGDITWIDEERFESSEENKKDCGTKNRAFLIEDNRYRSNFCESCFKILYEPKDKKNRIELDI